jgi:hypothetical protein
MRRGERGVAAQIDFTDRREPAQIETVSRRHQKRGLRKIVLLGDRLHDPVVEPAFEWADRRGVAFEGPLGKGIDLILLEFHRVLRWRERWAYLTCTPDVQRRAPSRLGRRWPFLSRHCPGAVSFIFSPGSTMAAGQTKEVWKCPNKMSLGVVVQRWW